MEVDARFLGLILAASALGWTLFAVLLLARRPRPAFAWGLAAGALATGFGPALLLPFGFDAGLLLGDLASLVAWCALALWLTVDPLRAQRPRQARLLLLAGSTLLLGAVAITIFWRFDLFGPFFVWAASLGVACFGLLLIENLWRNSTTAGRWHVNLLCVGFGVVFGFAALVYADALLFRRVSTVLSIARPLVLAAAIPLFAIGAARSRRFRVDIHVSRNIVVHTTTLFAVGAFLLGLGALGEAARSFDLLWGRVLQIVLLALAGMAVVTLLTSGRARSQIRVWVTKNFFSYRFDYREVWLGFIENLAGDDGDAEELQLRIVRGIADAVDSPGGALWLRARQGAHFSHAASWNVHVDRARLLTPDIEAAFRHGSWIVELHQQAPDPQLDLPLGTAIADAWVAVPLSLRGSLLGFVVLQRPRARTGLDWEVLDLLRVLGRQAASYLAEDRASLELAESRQFDAYARRFAFVVHDIKNTTSQLQLLLRNADECAGDPEFQADVVDSVRDAVASMTKMLSQMKLAGRALSDEHADAAALLRLVGERRQALGDLLRVGVENAEWLVPMAPRDLRSAIEHLLDNAVRAADGTEVELRLHGDATQVTIEIVDHGAGMAPEFLRDELFRPFRSGSSDGFGIGAYQSRELVRAAGGELFVHTTKGAGTVMQIVLPRIGAPSQQIGAPLQAGAA